MGDFLHEYAEILTDPAHFLVEMTNTILIDVVLFGMVLPFIHRRISKAVDKRVAAEHAVLDAEHGIVNHGARVVVPAGP